MWHAKKERKNDALLGTSLLELFSSCSQQSNNIYISRPQQSQIDQPEKQEHLVFDLPSDRTPEMTITRNGA